ncbi:MAG TPA: winged helix-turn-helix domain-containing protein [Burkholderiaceae bacterium]|nr:winged helix-turn-helix domain-containing protein [Burkholderiaceae bacterium]
MRFQFLDYRYDPELGLERPSGRIALRRSDRRLLELLLQADGRTVPKDTLIAAVWDGRHVSDDSLFQATRRLRAAMPAMAGSEIIQTIKGAGLRIGVTVRRSAAVIPGVPPAFAPSNNLEAVTSLSSAWELAARRSPRELEAAVEAVQLALRLDPEFVAAWCGLAIFHVMRVARMTAPPREAGAAAVAAADRALDLDAHCAPALAARGWVHAVVDLDVDGGVADLDRSVQITGNYWLTRGLRGWGYMAAGRTQDAVSEVRAALELNRWGNWYSGLLAQYLFFGGDREAALVEARAAVERFPEVEISHMLLSIVASGVGLHEEAIDAGRRAMELAPDTPLVHTALACALARGGQSDEATGLIRTIEARGIAAHCPWLATAYLALGRRDQAIDVLARARDLGSPQFVYAFVDPRLADLNGDPAFERLRPAFRPPR